VEKQKCKYKDEFDSDFKCDFDAVQDGLCIFHHPTYWKDNKKEVTNEFYKLVEEAIEKKKPLKCIGYNLPTLDLSRKEFKNDVTFSNAKFHEMVSFNTVKFTNANFIRATFSENANFLEATFSENAFFFGATFSENANFSRATFKNAYFKEAIFSENAYFSGATFKNAYFKEATFSENANFLEATFSENANFSRATFKNANFLEATFSENANFKKAIFSENANFSGATFKNANFDYARFYSVTLFNRANFLGAASFFKTTFSPGFLARSIYVTFKVSFNRVHFQEQSMAVFNGVDLSRVSFLLTSIDRVQFHNILSWGEHLSFDSNILIMKTSDKEIKNELKKRIEHLRNILKNEEMLNDILDEKFSSLNLSEDKLEELKQREIDLLKDVIQRFENGMLFSRLKEDLKIFEEVNLGNVLAFLRGLRENHDYYMKYEESGRFFIEEMELRRLSKKAKGGIEGWADWLILTIYKALGLYGESYLRPLIWAAILIVLTAVCRIPLALWISANLEPLIFIKEFLKQLKLSLAALIYLRWDESLPTLIERIISIPILGTLYISFRRRFERRMRH